MNIFRKTNCVDRPGVFEEGKNAGLAIAGATIKHLTDGCPADATKAELIERLEEITERWESYDPKAYQQQKNGLRNLTSSLSRKINER